VHDSIPQLIWTRISTNENVSILRNAFQAWYLNNLISGNSWNLGWFRFIQAYHEVDKENVLQL